MGDILLGVSFGRGRHCIERVNDLDGGTAGSASWTDWCGLVRVWAGSGWFRRVRGVAVETSKGTYGVGGLGGCGRREKGTQEIRQ